MNRFICTTSCEQGIADCVLMQQVTAGGRGNRLLRSLPPQLLPPSAHSLP